MKTKLTILSALSLVALMACQRETVDVNPTYDPERNTVTTTLVLNVSTTNGVPKTKQTALDVQASGNFRGMSDVHVLAYSLGYDGVGGAHYLYKVDDTTSRATRDYDLSSMISEITRENSTRILEMSLPLGTNSILLYGKAAKTSTDNMQGAVEASIQGNTGLNSNLSTLSFKLKNRLAETDTTAFRQYGDLMGRILTGIMNSGLVMETPANGYKAVKDNRYHFWYSTSENKEVTDTTGWNGKNEGDSHEGGYTYHTGSKTWRQYGKAYASKLNDDKSDDVSLKPLEEVMGEAYYELMTLKGTESKVELRTGSSASVLRMTNDLFNILSRVLAATPTGPEEYLAQLIAQEILKRSRFFFGINEDEVIWQPLSTIMDGVTALIPDRTAAYYNRISTDFFYSEADGRPGFPLNLGLPMGAAIMRFISIPPTVDDSLRYDVVTYLDSIPAYGMGNAPALSIHNYRYPAELMYYTNSSIRISDKKVEENTYPLLPSTWNDDTYWSQSVWTNNGSVEAETRAVAVTKPVNYGTALMKSTVGYSVAQIQDNNKGIHPTESNNLIDVSTAGQFQVTGIMIGGVCDEVGYDFLPKGNFDKMIYDKLEDKSFYIPVWQTGDARMSAPVYTLTWDNYSAALKDSQDGQSKVYVALEIVNRTGRDIWGELNLIRNGGTFYLVGELDPKKNGVAENLKNKSGQIDLTRPDFFYPPYDSDGKTLDIPRVFMQDYVTSVNFNFTETSLQHAYITMPDLRAGQVSLGLSVDINWEDGMSFDVNLGETSSSTPSTTEH